MSEVILKLTEREAELFRETAQQLLDFFADDDWQNGNGGTFYGARMARRLLRWAERMEGPSPQPAFPFPAVYRPLGMEPAVPCLVVADSKSGKRFRIRIAETFRAEGCWYPAGWESFVTKERVTPVELPHAP